MARKPNPYRRPAAFTRAAKARGFPARSVFKLEEIDKRTRLLRQGMSVLDLGAAPGSWSMYVSGKVGGHGKVLAIDLVHIPGALGANVRVVQGDALALDAEVIAGEAPYDVVLSDMAPSTTGTRDLDQARSFELFIGALASAERHLAVGGSFVGKIFMSGEFPKAKEAVRRLFEEVRAIRPEGVRSNSFELFIVGLRRRAPAAEPSP
ncbi:MAG: RlmE family RNA methyltransferase [Polyangiaceae bacterium]